VPTVTYAMAAAVAHGGGSRYGDDACLCRVPFMRAAPAAGEVSARVSVLRLSRLGVRLEVERARPALVFDAQDRRANESAVSLS